MQRLYNIVLCCTSRVGHIIGMCERLIAEHKVESMCGTAQRNAAFGAHSTQDSAQYHTEDRQAHKGTHSSKASKQYHTAQKQAHKLAHGMTKQRGKETKSITAATATKQERKHSTFHTFAQRGIIFSTRNARIPRPSVAAWTNQSSLEWKRSRGLEWEGSV